MQHQGSEGDVAIQFAFSVFPDIQQVTELTGDASMRRYVRLHKPSGDVILVDSQRETDACRRFVRLNALLNEYGMPVPTIYAANDEQNILLIEDFGHQCLDVELGDHAEKMMPQALSLLAEWQFKTRGMQPHLLVYSNSILREEMSRMEKWFFPDWLDMPLNAAESVAFEKDSQRLIEIILMQPHCTVHRDFHCRNLMRVNAEKIGIIDYQDALWGSATYDLVSLTRDCYIRYPQSLRQQWENHFCTQNYPDISPLEWQRYCHATSLQRHIKVLGLFVRLAKEKQKNHYLKELPRVWAYVVEESQALVEDIPFIAEKIKQIEPEVLRRFMSSEHCA